MAASIFLSVQFYLRIYTVSADFSLKMVVKSSDTTTCKSGHKMVAKNSFNLEVLEQVTR